MGHYLFGFLTELDAADFETLQPDGRVLKEDGSHDTTALDWFVPSDEFDENNWWHTAGAVLKDGTLIDGEDPTGFYATLASLPREERFAAAARELRNDTVAEANLELTEEDYALDDDAFIAVVIERGKAYLRDLYERVAVDSDDLDFWRGKKVARLLEYLIDAHQEGSFPFMYRTAPYEHWYAQRDGDAGFDDPCVGIVLTDIHE